MSVEPRSQPLFTLLKARRFAPLLITQFLGELNANLFRNALIALLTLHAASWTTIAPGLLASLVAGVFILPFFLFSATAGQLADKFDKAKLARLSKVLEMLSMGVAALGFFMQSLPVLLAFLFLLGLYSTLFSPLKYAILPQHLREEELISGNALLGAGALISILLGTLVGSLLVGMGGHPAWIACAGLAVAAAGFLASCGIPAAPAPEPRLRVSLNPLSETWCNIGFTRKNRRVFLSIFGVSWFWLYSTMLLTQIPVYAKTILGGDETSATLLLAVLAAGIGFGSILCKEFSARRVEIGLVPFGAIGMTIFGLDLAFASPSLLPAGEPLTFAYLLGMHSTWRVLFDLFMLGTFAGLFVVPLYVLMQVYSAPEYRGRIMATNNIFNALFMVVSALGTEALLACGVTLAQLFAIAALCNGAVAIFVYRRASLYFLRFMAGIVIHSMYRLEKSGLENIPDEGPAVLVCNHVSFIDPVVILGAVRRPIRFVMDHRIHQMPLVGFIFRHSRTIPIAPAKEDPVMKEAAFVEVARALAAGELIGLFPEGKITRDGDLDYFRYGIGRIVAETPVPVIPMALRGLWGSFFSRRYAPAMSKPSLIRPFRKIALIADQAVAPENVSPESLQIRVSALRGNVS